ncbi:hypothetical protein C8F04DRAFT_1253936 [Mycena alexandri]|uniref:Uncharacterized protein n=1 Tax=Mycena alexandri TaxID=1745969 RepID=A0AAD6T843_9AGAR|nr:hypothetical protein C8F04DRAFT_1253936 [Mycena alexandri]
MLPTHNDIMLPAPQSAHALCDPLRGQHWPENLSTAHAETILDADHYAQQHQQPVLRGLRAGQQSVPYRVARDRQDHNRQFIARALGRHLSRFSVVGPTDVEEVKASTSWVHPPVQALKCVGTENALVYIDEVLQIRRGINGYPALLELLEYEQNNGKPSAPLGQLDKSVDTQDPPSSEYAAEATPTIRINPRIHLERALPITDWVHVRITPDNLKDYVAPPSYRKETFEF